MEFERETALREAVEAHPAAPCRRRLTRAGDYPPPEPAPPSQMPIFGENADG